MAAEVSMTGVHILNINTAADYVHLIVGSQDWDRKYNLSTTIAKLEFLLEFVLQEWVFYLFWRLWPRVWPNTNEKPVVVG